MEIRIRQLGDNELEKSAAIVREEIYDTLTIKEMMSWMENGIGSFPFCQHFVATAEDEEILGFISWGLYDRLDPELVLEVNWMAVKHNFQRQGIGESLLLVSLEKVKAYWSQEGLRVRAVMVSTDPSSAGFYRKVLPPPIQERRFINVWGDEEPMIMFCKVFDN